MVVCSFFLAGKCKFGNACRNEHPRTDSLTSQNSKSDELVFKEMTMNELQNRPIWPLSCFSAKADTCNIIGGDVSFEESRLQCYQERLSTGNFFQYSQQFHCLQEQSKMFAGLIASNLDNISNMPPMRLLYTEPQQMVPFEEQNEFSTPRFTFGSIPTTIPISRWC